MANTVVVRGTNDKPATSESLADYFTRHPEHGGSLFIGYPIIGTADGRRPIDALLVSPTLGVVVFDLVEGHDVGSYDDRQDESATKLEARLLGYKDLVRKRKLLVDVHTLTYAPALSRKALASADGYAIANSDTLGEELAALEWVDASNETYERALSALQNISTIRRSRGTRVIHNESSRGAKLQRLEGSIATLDNLQSKAVIETVEGVQRIRGLAGSGKTIVLALKAAYLHAQHPDWRIAVTFNTRSLKGQFNRLINSFTIEQTSEEPNWEQIRVINAWGAPGGPSREGIYHEFCSAHGVDYLDFRTATGQFGRTDPFKAACATALKEAGPRRKLYDAILVDEAQDFPAEFLRMCYEILDDKRRLVYAYDELQSLSGDGLASAEEIFGSEGGKPRVSFDEPSTTVGARRDIILEKCYRNSRPVLVSAHGLGFGAYRPETRTGATGLVQMFDQPSLWTDIGYLVKSGELRPGSPVELARTNETSPDFLESHSPINDLIHFQAFDREIDQASWVAAQIKRNLEQDELRYDDIIVINTDPITTRKKLGPVRKALLDQGIVSHTAGVDTSTDVFFQPDVESITCTGIFRAKGNEAAMIYIINGQEAQSSAGNLALVRNRLFTAMTRSKAWVRVLGVGAGMTDLIAEFDRIKAANFELRFKYPSPGDLQQMRIVHRDMSASDINRVKKRRESIDQLVDELEAGTLYPEDLDPETLARLRRVLGPGWSDD